VVRKGATPAYPGQSSFIGGSMGDVSLIVEGVDSRESRRALYSTIHGAGRIMSRTEAAGRRRKGKRRGGKISRQMMLEWVTDKDVELRGAGTDESPHCYRRLPQVVKHHAPTLRILHTLHPIGVAMAGSFESGRYHK
jgi:tRNA-splicing ligase RtcB